jgi:sulfur-oxidizing protein SoxB
MPISRREFLATLGVSALSGFPFAETGHGASARIEGYYDLHQFGNNVTLLHFTDCHAQLLPSHFREPDVNIGIGDGRGRPPHLVGSAFLEYFNITPGSRSAHAFTGVDFEAASRTYGKLGGFAHLASLVKRIRAQRPGALLLDGGDNWQGSATSLWTKGADMIEASRLLGVDVMTGHWEFTYGAARVQEAVAKDLKGQIQFLAQNIRTLDFDDPVFPPYVIREINGVPIAIIGQAFPYTPIANPRHFIADWTFGIQEERLQKYVEQCRSKGAHAVVLLSHNGMDVDLKLASRVTGIDVILGGHTHDAIPDPVPVRNRSGVTLVTNAGCNGKFLAVIDLDVRDRHVRGFQYRLLPVFSNLLPADADMQLLIDRVRAPYSAKLSEKLAVTEGLLYRRGNFTGTMDQVILDAMIATQDAEIAFSPGFRWGTSLLPGEAVTFEDVMSHTAITYPHVTVNTMTGLQIKTILEDVCDNLFNPDPYYQQGGDMVRVAGLQFSCDPMQGIGARIGNMTLNGHPIEADQNYRVSSWAPVGEGVTGKPIWDVVSAYLKDRRSIPPVMPSRPKLVGIDGNPGISI